MTTGNKAEWSPARKWNPFNSDKLLAQVYRWAQIRRGHPIPQPALVTVDPSNTCNLDCTWCNSLNILENRNGDLSRETLAGLADFLPEWQGSPGWQAGVEAVCIAGGGEPLMNEHTGEFIERLLHNGVQAGVVTNGTMLGDCLDPLSRCTWVGVSVDAATPETFGTLKGERNSGRFKGILDGIAGLADYSRTKGRELARDLPGNGISFKFLLHPDNVHEIYAAAGLAKRLGCGIFHARPAGGTWDRQGSPVFGEEELRIISEEVLRARELEDGGFGVYCVTHKFDERLVKCNSFTRCHAIFMTAVFMPPPDSPGRGFTLGLCCDRRGDPRLEASRPFTSFAEVENFWGGEAHWGLFDSIDVQTQCPRCTYQPHNMIYEQVIERDSMTFRFI